MHRQTLRILLLALMCCVALCVQSETVELPCEGTTTTRLNLRSGPATYYSKMTTMPQGATVTVVSATGGGEWAKVEWKGYTGYASTKYLKLTPIAKVNDTTTTTSSSGGSFGLWSIVKFLIGVVFFFIVASIAITVLKYALDLLLGGGAVLLFLITLYFYLTSWPFFILNMAQRIIARPWATFFKEPSGNEKINRTLRYAADWATLPLYIITTPLRLINAFYFNMVLHLMFELFNDIVEVLDPTSYADGAGSVWQWIVKLPLRVLKYPVCLFAITVVESTVWTLIDTLLPALTLFHGTSPDAADNIVKRDNEGNYIFNKSGNWWVGPGNFAGDGIYFATKRSTADNYSKNGVIIVCRVTLGRILDTGLAPRWIFKSCGSSNAHDISRWGFTRGYTTGQWWRKDRGWWEMCMFDKEKRYDESWRIRPLYVLYSGSRTVHRVEGGMQHWLFSRRVINDMRNTIKYYRKWRWD